MADYTIERGLGVRERMDLLAAAHGPGTQLLLDQIGVGSGARCVDFGCGGGHVAMELARRVGPSGFVLGLDLDEELLGIARDDAAASGVAHVTFRSASIEAFSETDFDVAYARMVLEHLRDPAAMVAKMVKAVRSGGIVAAEDAHFAGCFTEPPCAGYDKWVQWFKEAVRRQGGDLDLGPRLPALLRAAGLVDIRVHVAQPVYLDGPTKQLLQLSMSKTRAAIVGGGIATADDYDAAHAELCAFTDRGDTLIASPRMVQTWGRRP